MARDIAQADWEALKREMRQILIGLARMRVTICYSDLAALLRTASVHHRSPSFHRLLDDMCREDEARGRASLAALVVRKDSGIPGAGFFTIAAGDGDDVSDPLAYWRDQFERACDYWSTAEDD